MTRLEQLYTDLALNPRRWLVTGCAGFIGSNLLETLLRLNQHVTGLDNFSTGFQANLDEVKSIVSAEQWARFHFIEGDIRRVQSCRDAVQGVDYVLHQAALGSVPRSLEDPLTTNEVNISGFLTMLVAARDAGVRSFVYAASSSTYGDHPGLPKVEHRIGQPLSPYAVTKYVDELYASVFARCYGFNSIGLRYFNVFGPRQHPEGAYAAVIPKWIAAMLANDDIFINGDGSTSRDFCYVQNAVQANLLAAIAPLSSNNQVYNIAVSDITSLLQLIDYLRQALRENGVHYDKPAHHRDFRRGDVLHSQANINKARRMLGYAPQWRLVQGIKAATPWYIASAQKKLVKCSQVKAKK